MKTTAHTHPKGRVITDWYERIPHLLQALEQGQLTALRPFIRSAENDLTSRNAERQRAAAELLSCCQRAEDYPINQRTIRGIERAAYAYDAQVGRARREQVRKFAGRKQTQTTDVAVCEQQFNEIKNKNPHLSNNACHERVAKKMGVSRITIYRALNKN